MYTLYETFETTSLGTEILPSKIINAFWGDNCFWFRMDNPNTDEFQQMYYSWCIDTKQVNIVDSDSISDNYEYSKDSNRSTRYAFTYTSKAALGNYLEITDNESGITKKVDSSILNTFEEGKKIKKTNSSTVFNISHAFEDDGTIYFVSIFDRLATCDRGNNLYSNLHYCLFSLEKWKGSSYHSGTMVT